MCPRGCHDSIFYIRLFVVFYLPTSPYTPCNGNANKEDIENTHETYKGVNSTRMYLDAYIAQRHGQRRQPCWHGQCISASVIINNDRAFDKIVSIARNNICANRNTCYRTRHEVGIVIGYSIVFTVPSVHSAKRTNKPRAVIILFFNVNTHDANGRLYRFGMGFGL